MRKGMTLIQIKEVMSNAVKGKMGTAAILGNHDYGTNWSQQSVADNVSQILQGHDIDVLQNNQKVINGLNFIGLDDYWGLQFNPEMVMPNVDSEKPNIVLCHNPDVCDLNVWEIIKVGYCQEIHMEVSVSRHSLTLLCYQLRTRSIPQVI